MDITNIEKLGQKLHYNKSNTSSQSIQLKQEAQEKEHLILNASFIQLRFWSGIIFKKSREAEMNCLEISRLLELIEFEGGIHLEEGR